MSIKPSTAAEYRKEVTRVVTNPVTGFSFKIQKPQPKVMLKLLALLPSGAANPEAAAADPAFREKVPQVLAELIPNCVIDPRVTLDKKEVADDVLHIDEIAFGDAIFLMTSILEFAGLTGPAAAERKKFRK